MKVKLKTVPLITIFVALLMPGHAMAHEDLSDLPDPQLQAGLVRVLDDMGMGAHVQHGLLAVALFDLSAAQPRLAMVNGHRMFYAASLPKIAILLGAAVALDEGALVMNGPLQRDLHDMIRESCNACATRVLDQIGRERLLEILQHPDYHLYDPDNGGGLWVGKPYGPESAYRRDPLGQKSHGATAYQAARFYYLLHERKLVNAEQSEMMLSTLANPGIDHKFVRGLSQYKDLKIFRKSGSWKQYHADSALVESGDHSYIMVALIEDAGGGMWMEMLAPRLHELITEN